MRGAVPWVIAAMLGCRSSAAPPGVDVAVRAVRPALALPGDWDALDPGAFERLAGGFGPGALSTEALEELAAALGRQDQGSVRAAVLLARSADPRAGWALLERLEARVPAPERQADAGDAVAAAALADWELAPDLPARLAVLAIGPDPHPDLEVRVECARSAQLGGRDEVQPFLLRVLRAGTPDEERDAPDWEFTRTLAWAKSRAAEALSFRAGVPCTFRPDGSFAHQMAEADRLEALLARARAADRAVE